MSDDIIKIEAEILSPKIETQVGIIWQGAPGRGFVDISSHWLTSDLSLENISIDMEGWVDDIQWVDGSKRFLYKYETITWTSEPTTTLTQPVLVGVWKLPTDLEERLNNIEGRLDALES